MFCDCFKIISSQYKVMPDKIPNVPELCEISILKNERMSFQLVCTGTDDDHLWHEYKFEIKSELKNYITMRKVGFVPSELPLYPLTQEQKDKLNYSLVAGTQPGIYPDPLYPMDNLMVKAYKGKYDTIWITLDPKGNIPSGKYRIDVKIRGNICTDKPNEELSCTKSIEVEIIDAELPEQTLKFTQWFHADCIYTYYNVPPFSEEHWKYLDYFTKTAGENGINMILTPIFTPPLDTKVGGERPTIQLVDIAFDGKNYSFEFSKLKRWFDMCLKNGIKYFEMAHLYSQWGAKFCPKIMATVGGEYKRIFGWDTESTGEAYVKFLSQFLPSLTDFIEKQGLKDKVVFHISDEPNKNHLETYMEAKKNADKYLEGYTVIDALSDVNFFKNGTIETPVPGLSHTEEFIDAGMNPRWTYYCCANYSTLSNRFFAYHGWQTRVLGLQLFKYDIEGFLHWGYNFYNSQFSLRPINPYVVTDADCGFPSGDSFSVYPGDNCCIESMRLVTFYEGLQDMRALGLLASIIGKDETKALIDEVAGCNVTFESYPMNGEFILTLRKKVNELIKENL